MKLFKRFTPIFVSISAIFATWFDDIPRTITQPNGEIIDCFVTGDQYGRRLHDANDFTMIMNPEDGYYYYATKKGDTIIPTSFKALSINPDEINIIPNIKKTFSENVKEGKAALPPCHAFFQFYVADNKLSCQMYQRSADVFLGVPFNIASYSLLTFMIAQVCELEVGEFIHTLGDAHIYLNHIEQVDLQLTREPLELPKLELNPKIKNIEDFKYEDIEIVDYKFHPPIKGKISI